MDVTVLGPLTIDGSEVLSRRDRVVLESLAARPGQQVSADALMSALWGDTVPASAAKVLQGCVVRLRKRLGPDAIETTRHGYTLRVPAERLDSLSFERAVARGQELLSIGEPDRAAYVLREALDLWQGEPFADVTEWEPAQAEARRLAELRDEAEEMHVDAQLRAGRHLEVLAEAHALVRRAPLREHRWTLLARAQYQAGQQADALRTIHRLKVVLSEQLGIDAGADVDALEQSILRQDPSLGVPDTPHALATCPWQGLRSYEVGDADRFFGREAEIRAGLEILANGHLLALVGPSGSGKSSLMKAGIGASLRARGVDTVTVTPGHRPVQALTVLGSARRGAALLVDQLEEVFSLCDDAEERVAFLDALVDEASTRPVVVALRADRLADLTAHARFSRLVERGLFLVGGLDEEGLRLAVVEPARQAGLLLEPGLVDLLVGEVRQDPGALPLLSHALMETWNRREGSTLTVEGYRASGGIHGAVAQSAEQLYARIEPEHRHIMRELVLRLLVPGTEGEPMRSRVPRRLVGTDSERDRLIEMLVAARLITVDEGALEITHESLVRAWPRLRGWLDDDVEGRRILHHLSAAADAWDSLGRPQSELYRGIRLTRTLAWQESGGLSLTPTEEAFLVESRAQAQIEEQSAAERARTQARLIRRLRVVLAGAAALLLLSLAAGGMAAIQSDRAQESAAAALASRIRALAGGAAARSAATDDADTSLRLAVAAVALHESPETVGSLIGALSRHSSLARSIPLAGDDPRTLDVHPDGELVAVVDTHHHVRLLDFTTGEEVAGRQVGAARSETEENRPMRFSPDGRLLAVSSTALTDQPVVILDGRTLEPTAWQPTGLPRGDWQTIDLKFDQRSRSLVAVLNNMVRADDAYEAEATLAVVWTVDSRRPPRTVELPDSDGWGSAALSPDGSRLYTVAPDLLAHDLRTGSHRLLGTSDATFGALEVSPDGRLLAWGRSQHGDTLLVDARTGSRVHRLRLDGEQGGVRFSNDGRRVLTVIWHDRDAAVWDAASGDRLATLALGEGNSGAVDLDDSGTRVVSAAADGAVREWHVEGESRYVQRIPLEGLPWGRDGGACLTVPSPTGARVAYDECIDPNFRFDSLVMLDTESGEVTVRDQPGTETLGASGSWDGSARRFVQVVGDAVHVWDDTGRLLARRDVDPTVIDAQFTPTGDRLVLSGTNGRVSMLDAHNLEPIGTPVDVHGSAWAVPGYDDRHAFVTVGGTDTTFFWKNRTNRWALVDLEEGVVVRESEVDLEFPAAIALAADGQHAAIADNAGAVLIVDLTTGRPVRDPGQHRGGAGWLSFSSDGERLVTGGFDGTVVLWDVGTGTVLARTRVPRSVLTSPVFRPDGTILIVPWWRDTALYVWDPSTERALEFACRAAGRDLTESEWRDHFGSEPYQTPCASQWSQ